jgi:hypothetical protein
MGGALKARILWHICCGEAIALCKIGYAIVGVCDCAVGCCEVRSKP